MLLDEPTNNLDKPSKDWIEAYLKQAKATVLFVSHDEDFLRKVSGQVLYLDAAARTAQLYNAGYDAFMRQLAELDESLRRRINAQMQEIARIQSFVDKQRG